MKNGKKLLSMALSLVLLICVMNTAALAQVGSGTDTVHVDRVVAAAEALFYAYEGNYATVVCNDNGALSIGKLGWHGARALYLLQMILQMDPSLSRSILGDALYSEIANAGSTDWNKRILTESEASVVSALIDTPVGHEAQDTLAHQDISLYIGYAWAAGVRTDAAILYYCTIENQYGHGGATKFMRYVRTTMGITENDTINSLEEFHSAVLSTEESFIQNYIGYRNLTYRYIHNLHWPTDGSGANCPGGVFEDMPPENHWAHDGIDYAVENGLFFGVSATVFRPDGTMTRAMVVTVLYRMEGKPVAENSSSFPDVANGSWYAAAVSWAVEQGLTTGFEDGTFRPDAPVTREQLATFLYRYALSCGPVGSGASLDVFSDYELVGAYARTPFSWAVANGYIMGVLDGGLLLLEPKGYATRAQVAAIFMRYCENPG